MECRNVDRRILKRQSCGREWLFCNCSSFIGAFSKSNFSATRLDFQTTHKTNQLQKQSLNWNFSCISKYGRENLASRCSSIFLLPYSWHELGTPAISMYQKRADCAHTQQKNVDPSRAINQSSFQTCISRNFPAPTKLSTILVSRKAWSEVFSVIQKCKYFFVPSKTVKWSVGHDCMAEGKSEIDVQSCTLTLHPAIYQLSIAISTDMRAQEIHLKRR